MPVYYGCTNIAKYFPSNSFISLDANNLQYSIDAMQEKMASDYYTQNYASILEARELCLKQYSTAPGISNLVLDNFTDGIDKEAITIKPFKRSAFTDIKRKIMRNRIAHKIFDNA